MMKKFLLIFFILPVWCFAQNNVTPQFKKNGTLDSLGFSISGITGNKWLYNANWIRTHYLTKAAFSDSLKAHKIYFSDLYFEKPDSVIKLKIDTIGTGPFITNIPGYGLKRDTSKYFPKVLHSNFTVHQNGDTVKFDGPMLATPLEGVFQSNPGARESSDFAVFGSGVNTSTNPKLLTSIHSTVAYRAFMRGSTPANPVSGTDVSGFIIGDQDITAAPGGSYAMFNQLTIKPLHIINTGGASIDSAYSLNLTGPPTGATHNGAIKSRGAVVLLDLPPITGGTSLVIDTGGNVGTGSGGSSTFASNGLNKDVDTIKMGDSNLKHTIEIRDSLSQIDFILDTAYGQIGIQHHRGEVYLYAEDGFPGRKYSTLDLFAGDSTLATHNEYAYLYIHNNSTGSEKGFYIDETGIKVKADIDSLALYYNSEYSVKSIASFGDRYIPDVGYVKVLIDSLGATLPSQTGNAGKGLFTNGTNTSWRTVAGTGTVTSVGATGSNGVLITGSTPITGSGAFAFEVDSSKYATLDKLSTYLTKAQIVATYLAQSDAASIYLTQSDAASIYLTQINAAATYQPLISLTLTGSGNPTLVSNVLNIPQYTFTSGLIDASGTIKADTSNIAVYQRTYINQTLHQLAIHNNTTSSAGGVLRSTQIINPGEAGQSVKYSFTNYSNLWNDLGTNFFVDVYTSSNNGISFTLFANNYHVTANSTIISAQFALITEHGVAPVLPIVYGNINKTRYTKTIFTPTTGSTVNLINNQYNIINPTGALSALTLNLPSSPVDGDVVMIKFTQNVTTVTYTGGTVVDGINPPAGGSTVLVYDSGTTSWY